MTFLPIVERELRLAAQRRATFWLRLAAALVALLMGCGLYVLLAVVPGGVGMHIGRVLFGTLTWMSVIAASLVGAFFTADALSEEKREGTLGLLFLTNLRGYDVVFGKLLATSCRSIFPVLAIFPIFAATQLLGGVAGSTFWRVMLALTHTLIFSLICGLLVSALSRHPQKALFGTLALLFVLLTAGFAIDGWWAYAQTRLFTPRWSLISPFFVFSSASSNSNLFWPSLLVSQGLTWGLFATTCFLISRTWRERRGARSADVGMRRSGWLTGALRRRFRASTSWLESSPILWLVGRRRGQALWLWLGALILLGGWVYAQQSSNSVMSGLSAVLILQLIPLALSLWVASLACHLFAELRGARWIELLLVAPLDFTKVAPTAWRGLLRIFGLPITAIFLVLLVVGFTNPIAPLTAASSLTFSLLSGSTVRGFLALGGVVVWITNLIALTWFGFWMGLVSRNSLSATLKTLLFVQVIPSLAISFGAGILMSLTLVLTGWSSGGARRLELYALVTTLVPMALSLTKNWVFYFLARKRMGEQFRATALQAVNVAAGSLLPVVAAPPVMATPPRI